MKRQMTRWGVGPKFTFVSLVIAILISAIHFVWLSHIEIPLPRTLTLILGIVLVIIGIPIFLVPGLTIDRYFKLAGIEGAKVNDLRHTFIAHHLASGTPLTIISRLVGHKRLSSTEKYLNLVKDKPSASIKLDEL